MSRPKGPPLWAVDIAKRVSRGMTQLQRSMAPSSAVILEIMAGIWRPYALWIVAENGIADLLADGPRDVSYLAKETGNDEEALFRVLRPLAHDGILERTGPRTFALTSLSQTLRSDHKASVRQFVRQSMGTWNRSLWNDIGESVRTGERAVPRVLDTDNIWEWFANENPEAGQIFHDSMAELTTMMGPLVVVAVHDFGPLPEDPGHRRRPGSAAESHPQGLPGAPGRHPGSQAGYDLGAGHPGAPRSTGPGWSSSKVTCSTASRRAGTRTW